MITGLDGAHPTERNWWREYARAWCGLTPEPCDCGHEKHSRAPGIGCTTAGCLCLHDGTPRTSRAITTETIRKDLI